MNINTPAEILEIWIGNGEKKAALPSYKMILLGILAGMYIGLGAHAFLLATAGMETAFEAMLGKLVGAALFPVGLMLVIFCGAELFTGNNLLMLARLQKKITTGAMLKNWILVYLANFVGGAVLALLLAKSGLYTGAAAERAVAVAVSKAGAPFGELVIRGIFCNVLVVLACWFQAGAKSMIGKTFAVWFPILLFVFCGFEHSVANMMYIPLGMFLGAEVGVGQLLLGNLLPVTIGNLLGGAVLIPVFYYFAYRK